MKNILSLKKKPLRAMGCHSPLTAQIVKESGFDAVWLSGLEVSTSFGVPDANFISPKQMFDLTNSISSVVEIPIIVDMDNGYGDHNNAAYAVKQFEKNGASAVCIEDKKFPKTNSFFEKGQRLETIDDFSKKIIAMAKAKKEKEFKIIARTETLIAGGTHEEALQRTKSYVNSGADMILIHSKSDSPEEVKKFVRDWSYKEIPLVIVPTTYYTFSYQEILNYEKIKLVIYANHGIRSQVSILRKNLPKIIQSGSTEILENNISKIKDLFKLQGLDKLNKL